MQLSVVTDVKYIYGIDLVVRTGFLNPVFDIEYFGLSNFMKTFSPLKVGEIVVASNGIAYTGKQMIYVESPNFRLYKPQPPEYSQVRTSLIICYNNILETAVQLGCKCVLLPVLYNKKTPELLEFYLQMAKDICSNFMLTHEMDIILILPDKLKEKLDSESEEYFEDVRLYLNKNHRVIYGSSPTVFPEYALEQNLKKHLAECKESFFATLLDFIDKKQMSEVEIYKKAQLDRRLFSKIRSNLNYIPSKNTIFSLAIALELSVDETEHLLKYAGYTFSPCSKVDVIVHYFIENNDYDIHKINHALFHFTDNTLNGASYRKVEKA